jgi:hypothetical protein
MCSWAEDQNCSAGTPLLRALRLVHEALVARFLASWGVYEIEVGSRFLADMAEHP